MNDGLYTASGRLRPEVKYPGFYKRDPLLPKYQKGDPISAREREVADLLVKGLANREIADELVVGIKTVESHVAHLHAKAGTHGRVRLAFWWYFERSMVDDLMRTAGVIA